MPTLETFVEDSWPPRVRLVLTGLIAGAQTVSLYRYAGAWEGGQRQLIRGGDVGLVTDTAVVRTDAEMPYGVPVEYAATVDGNLYTTGLGPVVYALPGGQVAMSDAITGAAAEVVVMSWPDKTRPRRATRFDVGGRTVVVGGQLGAAESTLEVYTETETAAGALVTLLESATGGTVQIRQPGGYGGVDAYLAVLQVTESRWSQDGTDQRRTFALDVVETEAWAPALEARGDTLQALADAYPPGLTLQRISEDFATLLDIATVELSA